MVLLKDAMACEGLRMEYLQGYGTSEGTKKAWDTRGRGGKQRDTARQVKRGFIPKRVARLAKASYKTLKTDDATIRKIERSCRSGNCKSGLARARKIGLKQFWVAKRLGDFMTSAQGFHDLSRICYNVAERIGKAIVGIGGIAEIAHAFHYAVEALGPVIHNLVSAAGTIAMGLGAN